MPPKTEPLLPLLGLCALLAASPGLSIALALGGATLLALAAGHGAFVALRRFVPEAARLAVCLILLATVVTASGLLMQTWMPQVHATAGLLLPLVVVNAAILTRGGDATLRGALLAGTACLVALPVLGAAREWLGGGALFPPLAFAFLALLLAVRNFGKARA